MQYLIDLAVDPGNADQLSSWDGEQGQVWATHSDYFDRMVRGYTPGLLAAADLGRHWRVLDVGCGGGETTLLAARTVSAGLALGVDLSSSLTEVARSRADRDGLGNVDFRQGDVQVYPFLPSSFDAVISRMGTSFFADPAMAFANLAQALRPGGRLTMLVWQALSKNEWLAEIARALTGAVPRPPAGAPGPFALADPHHLRSLLWSAGFVDPELAPIEESMWVGHDVDHACEQVLGFAGWMIRDYTEAARARAIASLRHTLAAHQSGLGVTFASAAWLVTAERL